MPLAWLTRVRLTAQRRVRWLRTLWAAMLSDGEETLAIPHSEVDRILAGAEELADAERHFYRHDEEARRLTEQLRAVEAAVANDTRWNHVREAFDLSGLESDLLALAVAAALDPPIRRVYGYLHDETAACDATLWLAGTLFGWPPGVRVGPDAPLVRWRLAYPSAGGGQEWTLAAPWVADPGIVAYLTSVDGPDPTLGDAVIPLDVAAQPCLYPEQRDAILTFLDGLRDDGGPSGPVAIEVVGPSGTGKRTLLAQVAAALGHPTLAADARLLAATGSPTEAVIRAVRASHLSRAMLVWHHPDAVEPAIESSLPAFKNLTLIAREAPGPLPERGVVRRSFVLPRLSGSARVALWRALVPGPGPVPDPIQAWLLTPDEIGRAARVAPAGPAAVTAVCRELLAREPGELFTPLICPYTWDDLVLAPTVRQHLGELESQARLRRAVFDEWGFVRLRPLGQGITALFAGPSGTGKTMAAQVLARALDMECYRIDLAGVMNKYIGETEKRLRQVFDTCERANVLLFFDEADALFGKRTQVKDAHDRFANIEIDYLLQRMELFDGIAILATNRKGDLDTAFVRRLGFIVDFMPPTTVERRALWRHALLERAPDGAELLDQIDWDFLAERLTMSGADIKAAALGAAFLARAEETRIGMRHILTAARRETAKHGVVIRAGEWEG